MLGNPLFLLIGCSSIQFFDSTGFSQHSQLGYLLSFPPSLCRFFMIYRTTCHSIGHQLLPTQYIFGEAEYFQKGGHIPNLVATSY